MGKGHSCFFSCGPRSPFLTSFIVHGHTGFQEPACPVPCSVLSVLAHASRSTATHNRTTRHCTAVAHGTFLSQISRYQHSTHIRSSLRPLVHSQEALTPTSSLHVPTDHRRVLPAQTSFDDSSAPEPLWAVRIGVPDPPSPGDQFCPPGRPFRAPPPLHHDPTCWTIDAALSLSVRHSR